MSSSVRKPCRSATAVSGGKILRGRRVPPSASPYIHPDESGSATWISGIFSGAGKLISSVFNSDSASASSSSSYSSSDDEDEDTYVSSKETYEVKQIEKSLEPIKYGHGKSLAIISEIEPKNAIEQLIMQETFSRDEGSKLIKIIQSRVVEVGEEGINEELIHSNTHKAIARPGIISSSNQSKKLPEAISYSSGGLTTISPPPYRFLTPNMCNSAVMEAKKWVEDKKLPSRSNVDFDCRSDMLKYGFGDEGSPIDMAKSYMKSLPPWRSPTLSSIGFDIAPLSGVHLYKDESPSSKGLKRNHPVYGWADTVDENRRVRKKLNDRALDDSNIKPIDSSERHSKTEAREISHEADKLICPVSSTLPGSYSLDASAVIPAECSLKDNCEVFREQDEATATMNHPERAGHTMSPNLISDLREAVNEGQLTRQTSSITNLPSRLDSLEEVGLQFCDPAATDVHGNLVGATLFPDSDTLDAPAVISAEFSLKDDCGVIGESGETTVQMNLPEEEGNTISPDLISDSREAVNELQSTHQTSSIATLPSELDSLEEVGRQFCDPAATNADGNQVGAALLPGLDTLDASAIISAECSHRDGCGVLREPDGTTVQVNHPETAGNTVTPNFISNSREAVNEVQSILQTSSIDTLPSRLDSLDKVGPRFSDPVATNGDGNQVKQHPDSSADPRDTTIPAPTSAEHAGAQSVNLFNSESEILPPLDISSSPRLDVNISGIHSRVGVESNSLHQNLISCAREIDTVSDLMPQDGNDQIQDEAIQQDGNDQMQDETIGNRISANGSPAGLNADVDVAVEEEPTASDISEAVLALPYVGTGARKRTNGVRARSGTRGSTKMKPAKDTSLEPQPPGGTHGGRGRKAVPVARRGKGEIKVDYKRFV